MSPPSQPMTPAGRNASPRPRPLLMPVPPRRRGLGVPLAILALGLASALLVLGIDTLRQRLAAEEVALMRTIGDLRSALALSHLWMEEYVAGDRGHRRQIWGSIHRARSLTLEMLGGGSSGIADYRIPPVEDPALRRKIRDLLVEIDLYAEITQRREVAFERGDNAGAASLSDDESDRIFSNTSEHIDLLIAALEMRMTERFARSRVIIRSILLAWVILVTGTVLALWSHARRRQQAELALHDREVQILGTQKLEAMGRLAGGIAHDVNNYLAAIRMQCELARRKAEPGGTEAERMTAVVATAERASLLIGRILAFGRRQPDLARAVSLNDTVRELEGMVRQLLGEDIELETRLAEPLWAVYIDPSQLEQVIVNLLVNAREAMPRGGRVVLETADRHLDDAYLERRPVVVPGDYVVLAVTDTGTGIPAEIRDRIFDPFFTTKGEEGSGLGLATTYGIVKQCRGNVWVYSEAGMGTAMKIYLPRFEGELAVPRPGEARPEERVAGGTESILLVEDSAELRRSARETLESLGYRVTAAADAAEALLLANRAATATDLLLTDVVLPGMTGPDLAGELGRLWGRLAVVYVSGYSHDTLCRRGLLGPEASFLTKPFAARDLARTVRRTLDRHREAAV